MEIHNNNNLISQLETPENCKNVKSSPSFRGVIPVMNGVGSFMQSIENGGFLASFLIQDFLGMTIPRTCAGFLRDKEVTGKYNKQEGFEVLGREGLTGPCMMAVAPVALLVAAKCGKTTSVNSQLIKRFGNSLKEIVANKSFNREILSDKKAFKEEFYSINVRRILEQTLGKENVSDKNVKYIINQIKNYENIPSGVKLSKWRGKSRYRQHCMNNIIKHIDNIRSAKSADLDMLRKVKFGSDISKDQKVFDTQKTIEAMIKYSDDAIVANKHLDKLDEAAAESIKCKSLAKRLITNISMVVATLSVLSILPKIYARSNVAPGARKNFEQNNKQEENNNISFKANAKNSKSFLEKLGKLLDKNKNDFVSSELEYNGHNFTNTLMACLSIFGLIAPRGLRAYNRAEVDKNGNKDYTEIWEILLRDVTSSLAVVFAVPMLTRAAVNSYEKKTGYVLMQKDRSMNKWKNFLDIINPYSKTHVLTNAEITSLYNGVNNKEQMLNFCKYIDKNGGDLEKILAKSEEFKKFFNKDVINLQEMKNMTRAEKNNKIMAAFEKFEEYSVKMFGKSDKHTVDKAIRSLVKGAKPHKNYITKFAKGLNSMPALIATLVISPYLLGWVIPRLTYKNTRRIHAKQDRENERLKTQA